MRIPPKRWVSPFGNPRIKAYLSAPRGLSQTYTSFIAFCRQGIHRVRLVTWSYNPKPFRRQLTRLGVGVLAPLGHALMYAPSLRSHSALIRETWLEMVRTLNKTCCISMFRHCATDSGLHHRGAAKLLWTNTNKLNTTIQFASLTQFCVRSGLWYAGITIATWSIRNPKRS